MTLRGGGRPRDTGQASLADVEIDDEHYARPADPGSDRPSRARPRAAAGRRPSAPGAARRAGSGLGVD